MTLKKWWKKNNWIFYMILIVLSAMVMGGIAIISN
jgi:hypothetical protein